VTRILSLNAGLLSRLRGLIQPAPEVEARLMALSDALREIGADIVALQEVYDQPHRERIVEELEALYAGVFTSPKPPRVGLGDGLFVLCNCAARARFVAFDHGLLEELWLARKGVLVVDADLKVPLRILNVHTTAGGLFRHPESPGAEAIRARQLEQLLCMADESREHAVLIVGDINAGPGVSACNYEMFERREWVDLWRAMHPHEAKWTWRPDNPLNVRGPHRHCPPQRIDHAFARRTDLDAGRIIPRRCDIVLEEARVRGSGGSLVPVSDHYGLLLEFDLSP
jgi:endonuclease/exonuclease/phosphatase family metal-dependent hydrolase